MATAYVSINPGATATLVAAVPGKVIRLHRVLTSPGAEILIKSDTTMILPSLKVGLSDNIDHSFTPGHVTTAAGEPLKITVLGGGVNCWIVYDAV